MTHRWVRKFGRYFDLGPSQIPPQPRGTAMVDRVDGLTYWISRTAGGSPSISEVLLPARWRYPIYGAYAGPYMNTPAGQIRLFMSSGSLTHEAVAASREKTESSRVYATLANFSTSIYQVDVGGGFEIGDPLILTEVTQ